MNHVTYIYIYIYTVPYYLYRDATQPLDTADICCSLSLIYVYIPPYIWT